MLHLRAEALRAAGKSEASSAPSEALAQAGGRERLRAECRAAPPYGFCYRSAGRLVAGESTRPVDERTALRTAESVLHSAVPTRELGDDLQFLAVVDTVRGTALLVSSIAACRAYFYVVAAGLLLCSTSLKAMQADGVALEMDEAVLPGFLAYRFVHPPATLCRGIRRIVGGASLTVDVLSGSVVGTTHWSPPSGTDPLRPLDERLTAIEDVLRGEVRSRVASSPHPALLLSGGLDSSLLGAMAAREATGLTTWSSGFSFADANDREQEYALTVARHLGLSHKAFQGVPEAYLQGFVESVRAAEEPVHHLQSVMLHLLFGRMGTAGTDIVLCGDGADRLFGTTAHLSLAKRRGLLRVLRHTGACVALRALRRLGARGERIDFYAHDFGPDLGNPKHFLWTLARYGDVQVVRDMLGCSEEAVSARPRSLLLDYAGTPLLDLVTILIALGDGHFTTSIWGRLAEHRGLAMSFPYTAPSLIDAVMAEPWSDKASEPKHYVRALLRRAGIPESFIDRRKLAFGFPTRHWALPGALFQPIVDMAEADHPRGFLRGLQTEESGKAMVLWSLLNLYVWRKVVLEGVAPEVVTAEILSRRRALASR